MKTRAGASPEEIEAAYRRRTKAAELRRTGMPWREVAAQAGYSDASHAHRAVKALLVESRDLAYQEIGLYRQESIERIEAVLEKAWPFVERGSDKHMAIALRCIKQISELRGEDAPVKVELGESDVDRLLRDALEEFRRRAGAADQQAGGLPADQAADHRA